MYQKLNEVTAKPVAWFSYTADLLWTDPHISKQMLSYHLNPEINAASRSFDFIDESVDWLVSELNLNQSSNVIDFGCGPGLYTHRFKQRGIGRVVGVDFSEGSLQWARQQANGEKLEIEYNLCNYLEYQDARQFDLITLVMCDFCALSPTQRASLLIKFKSLLKPEGRIALDVFTESRFLSQTESVGLFKNHMNQFWSPDDYWCIQSSFAYQPDNVWLDKFVIVERDREWAVYNWLQHYNLGMLKQELSSHGFEVTSVYGDLRGRALDDGDEMAVIMTHK